MNLYARSYSPVQANAPAFAEALRASGMPAAAWCVEDMAAKLEDLRTQNYVLLDTDYELRKLDEENDRLRAELEQYKTFFETIVNCMGEINGSWPCAEPWDNNLINAVCDQMMNGDDV